MIRWSGHSHAPYYLAGVSFAESSFFPIPPDVMLITMGLAAPEKSWRYALITTIFSVLGGLFGYLIGFFGIEVLSHWLNGSSYYHSYLHVVDLFKVYGLWIIFIAGFSPIPYKLFTIAAGALHMAILPFVLASFLGRGLRFFLVSGILFYMGDRIETKLRPIIDWLGWLVVLLIVLGFIVAKYIV
ncbi:YqaA family protein [Legionella taurinensis]|nr:YqaA family protein [Legionella taurinensis]MDX1837108.1 YqaA family protein [Legionella taurinensis]